jgi:hypothetical protein
VKLTDGNLTYISTDPLAWVDVTQWNLSKLKMITNDAIPGTHEIKYRLTTTETSNGSLASVEKIVIVRFDEVLPQISEQRDEQRIDAPRVSENTADSMVDSKDMLDASEIGKGAKSESQASTAETALDVPNALGVESFATDFHQDLDMTRQYEALQRTLNRMLETPDRADSLDWSVGNQEYRQQDMFHSTIGQNGEVMNSATSAEVRSGQVTEEATEERVQEQIDLEREVERGVSLQGRVVAFWNMLRGGVIVQETAAPQENRMETRTSQRSNKNR